jgi:hypothetical protein
MTTSRTLTEQAVKMHWYTDLSVDECEDILKGTGIGALESEEWD